MGTPLWIEIIIIAVAILANGLFAGAPRGLGRIGDVTPDLAGPWLGITSQVIGAPPPPAYSGGRERRPARATTDPPEQAESRRQTPQAVA
jgi:hypothetical protein